MELNIKNGTLNKLMDDVKDISTEAYEKGKEYGEKAWEETKKQAKAMPNAVWQSFVERYENEEKKKAEYGADYDGNSNFFSFLKDISDAFEKGIYEGVKTNNILKIHQQLNKMHSIGNEDYLAYLDYKKSIIGEIQAEEEKNRFLKDESKQAVIGVISNSLVDKGQELLGQIKSGDKNVADTLKQLEYVKENIQKIPPELLENKSKESDEYISKFIFNEKVEIKNTDVRTQE